MSRNFHFVAAAKRLILMQVVACVGAAAVTGWAAFAVRDLVNERDGLEARLAQLEARAPPGMLPLAEMGPEPENASIAMEAQPAETPVVTPPDDVRADTPDRGGGTVISDPGGGTETGTQTPTGGGDTVPVETNVIVTPPPPPPDEPQPARDCRRVDGRAIVCVPPFTRTPVRGVCVDGRARPVRCPPGLPIQDPPRDRQQEPTPTRR